MTQIEQHLVNRIRQLERQITALMRFTQPLGSTEVDEWKDSRRRADIELHEMQTGGSER